MSNRTSWKPGQSGNPNGRPPKSKALTDTLREVADMEIDGVSKKRILADKVWELAIAGDIQAIKYIYDRIDGTPTNKHEIGGDFEVHFDVVDGEL